MLRPAYVEPKELRQLDRRARTVIALFAKKDGVSVKDIAESLGLSNRMARVLVAGWVKDGWLEVLNESNRSRAYGLAKKYERYVGVRENTWLIKRCVLKDVVKRCLMAH